MLQIPENVRKVIIQLVPASIVNEITSYVFYDNHPRDENEIDIIVCTKMGEVREYLNRDLLSSVNLLKISETSEIRILRNSKCELFYLVVLGDELTILSRKDKLEVLSKLTHVTKYEITDAVCSGKVILKVETEFSDGPVVPDENFENFKYLDYAAPCESPIDLEMPIIKHLMTKVTESRHTAECIKQTYKNFLEIRHSVAFSTYKKIQPNLNDSIFKDDPIMIASALKINIQRPWIKSCNKKIIIVYNVCNSNYECVEDVHILIHGTNTPSLEYTTKIFEKDTVSPFWREKESQILKPNIESALVVVLDMNEMKDNVLNKVEFNGVVVFKKSDLECSLPIEAVKLSSLEFMAEPFDALCKDTVDDNMLLAVLASTEKTDLIMRRIIQGSNTIHEAVTLDIFCKYLQMEKIPYADNIVIFRKSPYHVLNGVMIILNKEGKDSIALTVHSRTPSQVLTLLHLLHDVVPTPIVSTTPTCKITAKNNSISIGDANIITDVAPLYSYKGYATSVLNRTALVLNYLDNCMIHMAESKNFAIRNKIGSEIDIFAQGEGAYKEFKEKMWTQALKGVKSLKELILPQIFSLDDIIMESDEY